MYLSGLMRLCLLSSLCCGCSRSVEDETASQETGETGEDERPEMNCTYVSAPEHGEAGGVQVGVQVVADNLMTPWGIDWLPNGDLLVTERDGVLSRISNGVVNQVANVPIETSGEGGLLGLAVDPSFAENRWFYIYYTAREGSKTLNRVARWILSEDGTSASEVQIIVDQIEARQYHNGGRLRVGPDGKLYIGTGDAGQPELSQDTTRLAGKVLRVNLDGSIPDDNPYPGSATWVWGIRNTQGFDWREDGKMVITDHGPSGLGNEGGRSDHDEVTLASPGDNLGWPNVYACEEGEEMKTASITWGRAMPPGGAAIYTGTEIPEWVGDVLIGVLGFQANTPQLHRLRLDAVGNVQINEVYFQGNEGYGRLRDVVMGPDGGLYVTTSNCDGRGTCGEGDQILRLGSAN